MCLQIRSNNITLAKDAGDKKVLADGSADVSVKESGSKQSSPRRRPRKKMSAESKSKEPKASSKTGSSKEVEVGST